MQIPSSEQFQVQANQYSVFTHEYRQDTHSLRGSSCRAQLTDGATRD